MRALQPNSKGALLGLVLVLAVHLGLLAGGRDGVSAPTLAAVVVAAAVLVVYSEVKADRDG